MFYVSFIAAQSKNLPKYTNEREIQAIHCGKTSTDKGIQQQKMVLIDPCPSTITLNVNRLNFPIKRHRGAKWGRGDQTQLPATHRNFKDTHNLEVNGGKKMPHK